MVQFRWYNNQTKCGKLGGGSYEQQQNNWDFGGLPGVGTIR